jgi:hypothetical protein
MSFLTLSLPKEAANFLRPQRNSSAAGLIKTLPATAQLRVRRDLRIDPHRGKASGESAAAFFRGDLDCTALFASLVADRRRGRAGCCWRGRCGLGRSTKTLHEIADQPSQAEILGRQILHLHYRRNVETSKTSSPSIEGSQRHPGGAADFGDRHPGAGLIEQMKDFVFSESGPSHRIALMQLLSWDTLHRRRRRSFPAGRCRLR